MSAYMCSEQHLNTIVSFLRRNNASVRFNGQAISVLETPQKLLDIMVAINIDSVNSRYKENNPAPKYKFTQVEHKITPVEAFALLDGYMYQCVDTVDFIGSGVQAFVLELRLECIRCSKEYKNAAWSL